MELKKFMFNLKEVGGTVFLREGEYLSNYSSEEIDFSVGLPNGIFNKKYPGMGATYCEFMTDRDSIIVFPFRTLALEKAEFYNKEKGRITFFVGTNLNNESTEISDIRQWYRENKVVT